MIQTDGLLLLFTLLTLEGAGIPVPGETSLIAAAILAATTHQVGIASVILVAAAAVIAGGTIGYWIGRRLGTPLLVRYGRYIRLSEARLKTGRYLFDRHGGKIVFFGRFVVFIRAWLALIAGANRMGFVHFTLANAIGGGLWVTCVGGTAYLLGEEIKRFARPVAIAAFAVTVVALIATYLFFRYHEKEIEARAEAALPGPLS
jgi:membrane protein DedA with SNARE-associated domain